MPELAFTDGDTDRSTSTNAYAYGDTDTYRYPRHYPRDFASSIHRTLSRF